MGINQDPVEDETALFESIGRLSEGQGTDRDVSQSMREPLWSISQADALRLVQVYEEECGLMYPLFSIGLIVMHVNTLYASNETEGRLGADNIVIEDEDVNIVKMVVAIGLLLEGDGQSDLAETIFESVEPMISGKIMRPTNLKSLTLVVLGATYQFHSDEEGQAWRLIGLAARLCYELGLHRKDSLVKSFRNQEDYLNAIRLFWIVYALDRRWSFGTGMPFALQDADINALIPEPDDEHLYLKHSTRLNKMSSKIWTYNLSYESDKKVRRDEIGFFDFQIQEWYRDLPEFLKLDSSAQGTDRSLYRLRVQLFLRANQARIQIYRPILHSATSIMENGAHARRVVEIAKKTISLLIEVNRISDLYRAQQTLYNYFLVQALVVIFLATSHAPAEFFAQTRTEFYGALNLIKGFSTKSYISKRLWATIRDLKGLHEKIGALDRGGGNPVSSSQAQQPQSQRAASGDTRLVANGDWPFGMPGTGSSVAELGSCPVDGQQLSSELMYLFEWSGEDGAPAPSSQGYGGYVGASGERKGDLDGFNGNEQEFSRILGDLL